MCGIAGIISQNNRGVNRDVLYRMANAIGHRGPDGDGYWISDEGDVGLAHKRLAIIDLSAQAAQPMHFLDRYVIVYNGEIYNYPELKLQLENDGIVFRTKSDTEVILAVYHQYGHACLQMLDGMFAFAIWDKISSSLFAARDRFGEKPFYYAIHDAQFFFASEMKALWSAGVPKVVDEKMLANYLSFGQVQHAADKSVTFFRDIKSLPPSCNLLLQKNSIEPIVQRYWALNVEKKDISEKDAVDTLERLLERSVVRRLRSDVPVGSSLSGGLDSTTIAYFVNKNQLANGASEFKTFSAVFPGFEKNEGEYIGAFTGALGIENYTVTPTVNEMADDFEQLAYHQEEPFSSSSIYVQYRVYSLAKQYGIKSLLDGQGADEILAGYHKYLYWFLIEMRKKGFSLFKKELHSLREKKLLADFGMQHYAAAAFPKLAAAQLEQKEKHKIQRHPYLSKDFISSFSDLGAGIAKPIVHELDDILKFNTTTLGLEELLRFADRNSMAHGVEVRLPFLNHELVEFLFSLPSTLKIHNGFTKYILRRMMNGKLPPKIVGRTDKVGFEPPQKSWMEDSSMRRKIMESKQKLVEERILKPESTQVSAKAIGAHEAENYDWWILSAAHILPG